MDGLALTTATTVSCHSSVSRLLLLPSRPCRVGRIRSGRRRELIRFPRRTGFYVLAAKEEEQPKFDRIDQMELKFGQLLGEDPKLTLAKIMARKSNPDVSYLEVEKSFYKNKGTILKREELPFDVSKVNKATNSSDGLNLVRPVPREGVKFQAEDEPRTSEIRKPSQLDRKAVDNINLKRSVPNVVLRKPTIFVEDDVEDKPSRSRVRMKPNLTLKLGSDQTKERFSDMTLLRKPEPAIVSTSQESSSNVEAGLTTDKKESEDQYSGFTLLKKPEHNELQQPSQIEEHSILKEQKLEDQPIAEMQHQEAINIGPTGVKATPNESSDPNFDNPHVKFSLDTALQGKPQRLDLPMNVTQSPSVQQTVLRNAGGLEEQPSPSPSEDAGWAMAEHLVKTGDRVEVELISSSARGFVVSLGSLVGFLPYRNLAAKWKFLAFESWLRQKGLDPSMYKKSLGIIGNYDAFEKSPLDSSIDPEIDRKLCGKITPDMNLEDLLRIYDQEKLKFLSSFVGQKTKVKVVMADLKLRKLIVSMRAKEKEEFVEKKRNLMAKLQLGDVVKCCIKKITYFGIFVEVDGVNALIHNTEVSWDATLDPASYFKVGQILEAKVHQLDFTLERIFLSLKHITPDPLIEALESVVGDHGPLDGTLQAAEADTEWDEVESLINELQQIEGIQSVSKGRFFLSPGLAPTFQVYMSSMFDNEYKLLARSGNKVQEVIVQSSLDKEEMKSTILSCTSRVE